MPGRVSSKGAGYWGWLRCGHVGDGDAGWVGRARGRVVSSGVFNRSFLLRCPPIPPPQCPTGVRLQEGALESAAVTGVVATMHRVGHRAEHALWGGASGHPSTGPKPVCGSGRWSLLLHLVCGPHICRTLSPGVNTPEMNFEAPFWWAGTNLATGGGQPL